MADLDRGRHTQELIEKQLDELRSLASAAETQGADRIRGRLRRWVDRTLATVGPHLSREELENLRATLRSPRMAVSIDATRDLLEDVQEYADALAALHDDLGQHPKSVLRAESVPSAQQAGGGPSKGRGEKRFGDWIRTSESLGGGGQGDVFIAFHKDDTERQRPHALKQLRNAKRAERFRREIEAALALDHPNIIKVVAHDLAHQPAYLVTPLYPAGHLSEKHLEGMGAAEKLRLFARICRGVGHAHEARIIHRDLKPENVLMADGGEPVVTDFGLCYLQDAEGPRLTETQEVAGPRFYKAPELEDGAAEALTPSSDVYSLGKLLYWMFGGRAFEREKHRDAKYDLRGKKPRDVHALLYQLLDETIVLEAAQRGYQDGNALAKAAEERAQLIVAEAHVLELTVPQSCLFCRVGAYEIRVDPRWWYKDLWPRPEQQPGEWRHFAEQQCRRYGLAYGEGAAWLVLQCDRCGNVQTFQLFELPDGLKNWHLRK